MNSATCLVSEPSHSIPKHPLTQKSPCPNSHLVGMLHEHQRPDRDKFIRYQCENLNPLCQTMPMGSNCCNPNVPKECCQHRVDFDIENLIEDDHTGPYDFHSIMQYRADSLAYPGKTTLVSLVPGESVPELSPAVPSAMDFGRICKMYSKQCQKFRRARRKADGN